MKLINILTRFSKDEDGATLVEYGIALAIAVTVGTTAMVGLGGDVSAKVSDARCAVGTTDTNVTCS